MTRTKILGVRDDRRGKNELEMAGGIVTLWTILPAMIFLLYVAGREGTRNATWAELILIMLCIPGVVIIVVCAVLSILLDMAWKHLDKPMRKVAEDD